MMPKKIVLHVAGGIGKSIAATAVVRSLKAKHPSSDIIVITAYPDVFLSNTNVKRAYGLGQAPYFYEEHIKGQDTLVFAHDPYLETDFIYQRLHLIDVWCKMCGCDHDGKGPELFLTERERDFHAKKFALNKPIMVIQSNGGGDGQALKYSWARDIPHQLAQAIVDRYKEKYAILHIRRQDQLPLNDTIPVTDDFRSIVTLLGIAKKRVLMDSFGQHAAAAVSAPSTVLWIANSPVSYGYKIHDNITANPFTATPELKKSVFAEFDITGDPQQFPYNNENEIFDAEKVFQSIDKE